MEKELNENLKQRKFFKNDKFLNIDRNLAFVRSLSPNVEEKSPDMIFLDHKETDFFLRKIEKICEELVKMRENIVKKGDELCEIVRNLQKKSVNELLECEFELQAFAIRVEQNVSVNQDRARMIENFKLKVKRTFLDLNLLKDEIPKVFEIDESIKNISNPFSRQTRRYSNEAKMTKPLLSPNSNPKLITVKDYTSGLLSINLLTYHTTPLAYSPKIYPYCCISKISESKYFINGGNDGEHTVGDTYLLDYNNKSYKTLPSSIARDGSGTVYMNERVYVFGGLRSKNDELQLAQYFDLKTSAWNEISPLPKPSGANTASLFNDCILITGYNLSNIYLLNSEIYLSLLKTKENSFKYIFEKWVIDSKTIYELEDLSNNLWTSFNIDKKINIGWLYSFTSVRYRKYIYFLDDINGLMRLHTSEKKLELISRIY